MNSHKKFYETIEKGEVTLNPGAFRGMITITYRNYIIYYFSGSETIDCVNELENRSSTRKRKSDVDKVKARIKKERVRLLIKYGYFPNI